MSNKVERARLTRLPKDRFGRQQYATGDFSEFTITKWTWIVPSTTSCWRLTSRASPGRVLLETETLSEMRDALPELLGGAR